MQGYRVLRKIGLDTHGLPIEVNVEKRLGFTNKADIEAFGIENFCRECNKTTATNIDEINELTSNVTSGKGWSYGVEFLVRKEVGKFTGWVGYTLSWTKQQFDELNFGEPFFARYDRRHDVSIVLMYSPTKKINLSLSWVFATGNAVTLPTSVYTEETLEEYFNIPLPESVPIYYGYVENYGKKNDFRMKPFHHLDIGVQFIKPHTKNNGQSIFEVSIYNVYNHHNPFFYFIDQTYVNGQSQYTLQQISIFPIIPTFTYHFKF